MALLTHISPTEWEKAGPQAISTAFALLAVDDEEEVP